MRVSAYVGAAALMAGLVAAGWGPARCEIVDEIVAKVNDDIITKSDLDQAEQEVTAEMYRRHAGKELDDQVRAAREAMLRRLIDNKILYHRATRLYDMQKMGEAILTTFKEQQRISSDAELRRLLEQEGMSIDELKKRLVEMYAPEQVLNFEVRDRIAVGDKEVDAFYSSHLDEFEVPAEVTLREIVLLADGARKEARRADADAIRAKAAAPGADFAALARQYSEAGTREGGGLLGPLKKGDLSPKLEEAAFALPPETVSPVLDVPHGFHIIRVESRREARTRPVDEVRESVRTRLLEGRYVAAYNEFLRKAWSEAEVWVSPKYQGRLAPAPWQSDDGLKK